MRICFKAVGTLLQYVPIYLFALGVALLQFIGVIRVHGQFPRLGERPVMVIGNHPSLVEAVTLPFVRQAFRWYATRPNAIPLSTPATDNLWRLFWPWRILVGQHFIPIDRSGNAHKNVRSMRRIQKALSANRTIVFFPEGGRTRLEKPICSHTGRVMNEVQQKTHRALVSWQGTYDALVVPVYSHVGTKRDVFAFRWPVGEFWIGQPLEFVPENLEEVILLVPDGV